MITEARAMDKHRFEGSTLTRPLLTSGRAAAALLFQVVSIPVLGGPG